MEPPAKIEPSSGTIERGSSVGRYLILDQLGAGGMGVVYKAYDPELDRQVALKLLRIDEGGEVLAQASDRLLREAQALARLSHPNVVAVHDVGSFRQHVFLAMEFVEGKTLRHWLRSSDRSHREILDAFLAAGEGLAAAHRAGLVHRDFKPENVMIGTDGRVRVLDFGLVRAAHAEPAPPPGDVPAGPVEASESESTLAGGRQAKSKRKAEQPKVNLPRLSEDQTEAPAISDPGSSSRTSGVLSAQLTHVGSVLGTPRYMAPEQHRGEPADERADQFSFCLALCEALWGVDPFRADKPEDRVAAVLLGRVAPPPKAARVPSRLRAILMRGLQARPPARWPSMAALLAELRRDPAAAWRKAAVRVVSTLAVVAALAGGGFAIQARRMAAKQAQIAREFGLEQAQMAATARIAALLPLHDLRPEMDEIRAHLATIERQMREVGSAATGPGHAALGSGYAALEKWEDAVRELEAAFASGYRSPDLAYALGISHGKLYQKALAELVKTDDTAADAQRREAIVHAHRDPALRHLTEASRSASIRRWAPPEFVEGLIALYEERFDEALTHARKAIAESPQLFEAHTLEGDIHMMIGRDHNLKGEDEADAKALERAGESYRKALEMARSSFSALYGECRRLVAIEQVRSAAGHEPGPEAKFALAGCAEAAKVRPDEARPLAFEAGVWNTLALYQSQHDTDPTHALDEAKTLAEAALRLDPKSVSAMRELSDLYLTRGGYLFLRGGDSRPALDQSIAYARRGLAIDPTQFSLYTLISYAYADKGKDEVKRGVDPRNSFSEEVECAKQQRRYLPHSLTATNMLQSAYLAQAHWQRDHGVDPEAALAEGIAACEEETRLAPSSSSAQTNLCYGEWVYGTYLARVGRDPTAHLQRAVAACEKAIKVDGASNWIPWLDRGVSESALARWQLERGMDPAETIEHARTALKRALAIDANHLNYRYLGELELAAGRAQMALGRDPTPMFAAAEAATRKVLAADATNADVQRAHADIQRWHATWLARSGRPVESIVREGLAAAARAEALTPDVAESFAIEGALHLVAARAARGASEQEKAAGQARTALEKALAINGFLSHDFRPQLEEANRLVASREGPVTAKP